MSNSALKAAKILRVLTVPPICALILLLLLWGHMPPLHTLMAILFLCLFPPLSYLLCWLVPALRAGGRKVQRTMAVLFSVLGYVFGTLFCLLSRAGKTELVVYLTYLITGLLTALFSFIFKIKSSGHAAGVAGPVTMLVCLLGPWYLLGYLLLAAVFWSSLKLGRHNWPQLLLGSAIPMLTLPILFLALPA